MVTLEAMTVPFYAALLCPHFVTMAPLKTSLGFTLSTHYIHIVHTTFTLYTLHSHCTHYIHIVHTTFTLYTLHSHCTNNIHILGGGGQRRGGIGHWGRRSTEGRYWGEVVNGGAVLRGCLYTAALSRKWLIG